MATSHRQTKYRKVRTTVAQHLLDLSQAKDEASEQLQIEDCSREVVGHLVEDNGNMIDSSNEIAYELYISNHNDMGSDLLNEMLQDDSDAFEFDVSQEEFITSSENDEDTADEVHYTDSLL